MANKTRLDAATATLILGYYKSVYAEAGLAKEVINELMENLNMFENNEIYEVFLKIQNRLLMWSIFNMKSSLMIDLNRITYFENKYVSSIDLRKFKIDITEFPTKFKQEIDEFYNKVIEIKSMNEAVAITKSKVLKSIENIYFLVNRIKEVIENKIQ